MRKAVRHLAKTAFHAAGGMASLRWLRRNGVTILNYHQFLEADRDALREQCEYLRAYYRVIPMRELAERLRNGDELPERSVAITIDDGHRGFYRHAYPLFTEFGFPATMYLVSGFVDSGGWLWFDRIRYAFRESRQKRVRCLGCETELEGRAQRLEVAERVADGMKRLSQPAFLQELDAVEKELGVSLPAEPPEEFAPLRWEEVRAMDGLIEFGAHTVHHPILSSLASHAEIAAEIEGSKERIERATGRPVLHFAYPNGQSEDLTPGAVEVVRAAGFRSAVVTEHGQVFRGDDPALLKRVSVDPSSPRLWFRQAVAGLRN